MAAVAPPAITALPAPPDPNNRATFNALAYPWSVAQGVLATQLGAVATNVKANADDAATSASTAGTASATAVPAAATATTKASEALTSANAAAASAVQASKLNLGNKTSAPTVDNQGAALLAGANYYDTTLAKWRVWSGSAWVDGISAVAGVSTVNGAAGAVANIATTATNTFTAAQEWATGAAIASAATINLDTATGNRVHITGTTTITAITLTRGPRTVIFDSVLTLTHSATTNNLPGAANITTAAGDRAIYESDGATVYCVDYVKANGTAVVGSAGNHVVIVHTGNGSGSTTYIRRFSTTLANTGTAVTYADNATLGSTFTINEAGLYACYYQDVGDVAGAWSTAITVNSAELGTTVSSLSVASRFAAAYPSSAGAGVNCSVVVRLAVNDVIRAHASNCTNTTDKVYFSIRKVGV